MVETALEAQYIFVGIKMRCRAIRLPEARFCIGTMRGKELCLMFKSGLHTVSSVSALRKGQKQLFSPGSCFHQHLSQTRSENEAL